MGAELVLVGLYTDEKVPLNWKAGTTAINTMPRDALESGLTDAFGSYDERLRDMRRQVKGIFRDLRNLLDEPDSHVTEFTVRGITLHIAGGETWGDDPSEAFSIIANAHYFPEVLTAIGFYTDKKED